jgi:hypothetical protein
VNEVNKTMGIHTLPSALASGAGLKCFGNKIPCSSPSDIFVCNKILIKTKRCMQ